MLLAIVLTACGRQAPSSTPPQQNTSVAVATPAPSTVGQVSEKTVQLELGGVAWRVLAPDGQEPIATANQQGVLWIRLPAFINDGLGWGNRPRPTNDYAVMYTPFRPGGGDLSQGAQKLLVLPGILPAANDYKMEVQYVTSSASVVAGHFLLTVYRTAPTAQNGGSLHFWLIDPQTQTAKEALTAQGEGKMATIAHNDRWLFVSQGQMTEAASVTQTTAFLVDLQTGQKQPVHLGENDWVEQALWKVDGKLHFWHDRTSQEQSFDPATGQVATVPRDAAP